MKLEERIFIRRLAGLLADSLDLIALLEDKGHGEKAKPLQEISDKIAELMSETLECL